MAEWGLPLDESGLDETSLAILLFSFYRRTQWVAKIQSVAMVKAFSEAMGEGPSNGAASAHSPNASGMVRSKSGKVYQKVSGDAFLRNFGMTV